MIPTRRFFGVILMIIALWTLACAGAQQPDVAPNPAEPAATAERAPSGSAAEAPTPAAASGVSQQTSPATGASEQPADPAAEREPASSAATGDGERPILNAGVIWLDSPVDPVKGGYVSTQSALSETLFRLSGTTLSPEPWLATEATPVDSLTWRIKIREGVKFHNGNVMDAQAVKASLERAIRLSAAAADTLSVDTITVVDGQTITIKTTVPQPTLPGLLILPALAITDAAAVDAAGEGNDNFIAARALTGPYIPTAYVQKEYLNSVANDDYWGGSPPLAGINHLAIPDTNSRELALQSGDVDVIVNVSPQGAQAINDHPGTHTETSGVGTSLVLWWVNFERGTLADPLVRMAVAHALDRESISGLVTPPGAGTYAELLLPEVLTSCPGVDAPAYDPDKARELLAAAGYTDSDGDGILDKDGQPLEIIIGGYPERFQLPIMAEAGQAMLAEVGIKAEVLITEWTVVNEPAWDLFGWYNTVVQGGGDPVFNISKFAGLKGDASGSGTNNYGHYDSSRLAEIIAPSVSVSDLEGRKDIACEAIALVTEEAAFLPISHVNQVYGVSDRVTDLEGHPTSHYFFNHRVGLSE